MANINLNLDSKSISSINIAGECCRIDFNKITRSDEDIFNPLKTVKCSRCNQPLDYKLYTLSKEQLVLSVDKCNVCAQNYKNNFIPHLACETCGNDLRSSLDELGRYIIFPCDHENQ